MAHTSHERSVLKALSDVPAIIARRRRAGDNIRWIFVLTTSGFYGVIIDMTDDTVIVEFGNNKNCRIPMQKAAIAQLEKPTTAVKSDDKK